jgi:hypothetical protein
MPNEVAQHQLAEVITPIPGGPLSADTVRGHFNQTIEEYNAHDADEGIHIQSLPSLPFSPPLPAEGAKLIVGRALYIRTSTGYVKVNDRTADTNAQGFSVIQALGPVSGVVALDWSAETTISLTLAGNITSLTHAGMAIGSIYRLIISQDGTGGKTCNLSGLSWSPPGAPAVPIAANSTTIIEIMYDGTKLLAHMPVAGA